MLATPTKFTLLAGAAEGRTALNAFDQALLQAGIGNMNLIRVTSILPPGTRLVEKLDLPPGTLVPTAYGTTSSTRPGERIAAAVAVAISPEGWGVIMETSGPGTRQQAEETVADMARAALADRGLEVCALHVRGVEHTVVRVGSVFAGVALWY